MKNLILLSIILSITASGLAQSFSSYVYEYSDSVFNNPERGFYKYTERSNATSSLDLNSLENYRNLGYTIIYRIFYLRDFADAPISEAYLNKIEEDFNTMREAGIKGVIRFAYTSSMEAPYGDATPERVFSHIDQLKPILTNHSDVIFILQAGFIGAWGEWYYTDHFASGSPDNVTDDDLAERKELVERLLDALPSERMIQLRYVGYKMKLFDDIPVTFEEAYSGCPKSRISHHNDCFVSSANDVGSYRNIIEEKIYLEEDSRYTSIGGETCNWYPSRSNCDTSTFEMERFHWSFINRDYYGPTLNEWIADGCYDDMLKRLGYRYFLVDADIQDSCRQNGSFTISFRLKNIGYSNPINPRNLEIVIRNRTSGKLYYTRINTEMRKRDLHSSIEYIVEAGIPSFIPEGDYDVFLNLPDPKPTLRYNPDFSIRLANKNSWNKEIGMNSFSHILHINEDADCSEYIGSAYFISYSDNQSASIRIDGDEKDWYPVPVYYPEIPDAQSDLLKICDNNDTVFFMLRGMGFSSEYQIYIDADARHSTGMNNNSWADDTGIDILVQGNNVMEYDSNSSSWIPLPGEVLSAVKDSLIEIALPKNLLAVKGFENEIRFGVVYSRNSNTLTEIIPGHTDSLLHYEMSMLFGTPSLHITSYCENAVISIAPKFADSLSLFVIERSVHPDQDFSSIGSISGESGSLFLIDNPLSENTAYYYRAMRITGDKHSLYSYNQSLIPSECIYKYPSIIVDGKENDWNAVPPVNAIAEQKEAFIFKAYTDNTNLNLLFSGYLIDNLEVYIDTDNDRETGEINLNWTNTGFDYKYSEGQLFQYESGSYLKIASIDSVVTNENYAEVKIPLTLLELDRSKEVMHFAEKLTVSGKELFLPFQHRKSSLFERVLPPDKPQGVNVRNSVNNPTSKLIVTWEKCPDCDGYSLTRINKNNNDSTRFELLRNDCQLIDDGLLESNYYEYYVNSYNFGGISEESEHVTMATLNINSHISAEDIFSIWPVPATDFLNMRIPRQWHRDITELEIYSVEGKLILHVPILSDGYTGSDIISIPVDKLESGFYLLNIRSNDKNYVRKFTKSN